MGARHQNDRRHARAATLALLVLVAQLGGLLHDARIAHAVCADHGEEIHVAGGLHAVVVSDRDGSKAIVGRTAGDSGSTGHEHCGLWRFVRQLQREPGSSPPPSLALLVASRAEAPAERSWRGRLACVPPPARGPPVRG